MKRRLEDGNTVILRWQVSKMQGQYQRGGKGKGKKERGKGKGERGKGKGEKETGKRKRKRKGWATMRTFNIWSSVVFPALSRPKKSSFACLFISPRDARTS